MMDTLETSVSFVRKLISKNNECDGKIFYKRNVSYSLNAFSSWEGYYIMFKKTKGPIEHKIEEKIYVVGDGGVES